MLLRSYSEISGGGASLTPRIRQGRAKVLPPPPLYLPLTAVTALCMKKTNLSDYILKIQNCFALFISSLTREDMIENNIFTWTQLAFFLHIKI